MNCISGLVSIITPSYNTGKYINDTILSVINQSYSNWEMIIVDDCSTDDTEAIVYSFGDPRIRLLKNKTNLGAAISRNKAIKEANGEWIAFLDSDDLWTSDKLEKQLNFMAQNRYAFTCAYSSYIDEDSNSLQKLDTCPSKIGIIGMYLYNWVGCLTAMYHVPTVGLVQIEDIPKRNDYAIWLQIVKKTPCYCMPECVGKYRIRKSSLSHTSKKMLIKAHYNMFRKCEHINPFGSMCLTIINMVISVIRKLVYVKDI